jgi:3-hydroxyacyl-CoA dehydrogenase
MNGTARAPDLAPIATVGVVGAGFMGAQLALHIAAHGYPVAVADQSMDALVRMRRGHKEELDHRLATEGFCTRTYCSGQTKDGQNRGQVKVEISNRLASHLALEL